MDLIANLAEELIERHPARAAVALETVDWEDAAQLLVRSKPSHAARVLTRMTPQLAARILGSFDEERMAASIEALPLDVAARVVRRVPEDRRAVVLDSLKPRRSRELASLLRFPEGTAGALMDPNVLALPETFTAREAMNRVRESAESARYNLYVLDSEQRLVGAINLRELMLARSKLRLADLMARNPQRLDARADRSEIVAHPGWREVHSLPVVDERGGYLGGLRYRTLRALEAELFSRNVSDSDAGVALGELFTAGAAAFFEALSSPPTGRGQ